MAAHGVDTKVYKLSMVAVGGKFRGLRGATYKLARKYHGFRLIDGPDGVRYGDSAETSSNIYMDLYFLDFRELTDFKQSVVDLHLRLPDLIARSGLEHKPKMESATQTVVLDVCSKLDSVSDVEFQLTTPPGSIDYDRALQDLGSFAITSEPATKKSKSSSSRVSSSTPGRSSGRISRSTTMKMIPNNSPLCQWQTIEDPSRFSNWYECHVLPKSMGGSKSSNNLLAASWAFHQLFDGLVLDVDLPPGVPGLVAEFVDADGTSVDASDGTRYKVSIRLRFLDDVHNLELKDNLLNRLKDGSEINDDGSVDTFVHVLDILRFKTNLRVKQMVTEGLWEEFKRDVAG